MYMSFDALGGSSNQANLNFIEGYFTNGSEGSPIKLDLNLSDFLEKLTAEDNTIQLLNESADMGDLTGLGLEDLGLLDDKAFTNITHEVGQLDLSTFEGLSLSDMENQVSTDAIATALGLDLNDTISDGADPAHQATEKFENVIVIDAHQKRVEIAAAKLEGRLNNEVIAKLNGTLLSDGYQVIVNDSDTHQHRVSQVVIARAVRIRLATLNNPAFTANDRVDDEEKNSEKQPTKIDLSLRKIDAALPSSRKEIKKRTDKVFTKKVINSNSDKMDANIRLENSRRELSLQEHEKFENEKVHTDRQRYDARMEKYRNDDINSETL